MRIEFECRCGARMRALAEHVGKQARCPRCGGLVEIVAGIRSSALDGSSAAAASEELPPRRPLVVARPVSSPESVRESSPLDSQLEWNSAGYSPDVRVSGQSADSVGNHRSSSGSRRRWLALGISAICTLAFVGVGGIGYLAVKLSRSTVAARHADAGGNSGTELRSSGPSSTGLKSWKRESHGAPVTETEAADVMARFITAVGARDFNTCEYLSDFDWIYEEIAKEAKFSGRSRRDFMEGIRRTPKLWEQIYPVVARGGEFVMLHPIRRQAELRMIVRLYSDDDGLNYHEYIFARNKSGNVEITDAFLMAAGDTYSEAARRGVMSLVGRGDGSIASWLGQPTKEMIAIDKSLKKMRALGESDPRAALAEFQKLPADFQREKTWMFTKLTYCAAIGPEEYAAAFEEFRRLFPEDESIELLALDYYFERKDFPSAIASAERLNKYIGGDSKLEEMISFLRQQ